MNWDDTLYKIAPNTILCACAQWGAEEASLKLVSKGINLVYQFKANGLTQFMRITHDSLRNLNQVESAMAFQNHLFKQNVSVCKAIKSKNSNYIETIIQDEHVFLASTTLGIHGNQIDVNHADHNLLFQWGKELAFLHLSAQKFNPEPSLKYLSIFDIFKETKGYLENEDINMLKIFHELEQWLTRLEKNEVNFGFSHGDHRDANVIWNGKNVTIIDFDEPIHNWFMADIVRPFINLYEYQAEIPTKLNSFLEGYCSVKKIDGVSSKDLCNFARLKAFEMFLWTKNNWKSEIVPGGGSQKPWLESLKKIFYSSHVI